MILRSYKLNSSLVIEENVKKDEERTNSNSISFRNDSEHQNNKTENNTNYTDGSNSYEESSKNKMLLPYIPQTVCIYVLLYMSNIYIYLIYI